MGDKQWVPDARFVMLDAGDLDVAVMDLEDVDNS
jgi:hypothetical protein